MIALAHTTGSVIFRKNPNSPVAIQLVLSLLVELM
jgi:hypothetical protein